MTDSSLPSKTRAHFQTWLDRVRADWWADDPHLGSLLRFYGREAFEAELCAFAAEGPRLDPLVRENNRDEHLPALRRWDGVGNRIESIDFHGSYREIGKAVYASGVMSRYREPGRQWESLALTYLVGQNGEAGHACPLACTAGLIQILQRHGDRHQGMLERLYDPDYDTHFHGAQFLTEVQGGSDVGANAVRAEPAGHDAWRLTGEKWFCSVVDAQLFLVTARPVGAPEGTAGVRAFVVPRHLSDGSVNGFAIRRLKFKLGTRSMASGEIDFQGALAYEVGDFKDTVGIVLNTSRLYNAVVSAGILQRAWREADAYARTRLAFGRPILAFPAVARTVASLRVEAAAARSLSFALAELADRISLGRATAGEEAAWRMLVNLNKFWTSLAGTSGVRDAIEVLGGNGAIEEFTVLPRLLRDSVVCEQWEGPHNVLCAQVLRDSHRLRLHAPMFDWLESLVGPGDSDLAAARARWERLLAMPPELGAAFVRDAAMAIRPLVVGAVLRAEAAAPGAWPLLPVIADHLRATGAPGYDPTADPGLLARVEALVAA